MNSDRTDDWENAAQPKALQEVTTASKKTKRFEHRFFDRCCRNAAVGFEAPWQGNKHSVARHPPISCRDRQSYWLEARDCRLLYRSRRRIGTLGAEGRGVILSGSLALPRLWHDPDQVGIWMVEGAWEGHT